MERRFRHSYEVRYDECNVYGFATPTAILRYMQDIAGLDSKEVDLSEGGAWIARRTVVEFQKVIPARAKLEVETYPSGFSKVTALRGYFFYLADQEWAEPAIKARTLWVYLDPSGRPGRIPESYVKIWLPGTSKKISEEAPWPPLPQKPPFLFSTRVNFSDLDVMAHMNNTSYVEGLDNAGWRVFQEVGIPLGPGNGFYAPVAYDIEHQKSARLGEQLQIQSWFYRVEGAEKQFERFQLILGDGVLLARSRSRWEWLPDNPENSFPVLSRLWETPA